MFRALLRFFRRKSAEPRPPSASQSSANSARRSGSPVSSASGQKGGRGIPAPSQSPAPPPAEAAARQAWEQESSRRLPRDVSPEELCGITPDMDAAAIRNRIAFLYQRHNRAASSLDPGLQSDAEYMLESLALLREKYFGAPEAS